MIEFIVRVPWWLLVGIILIPAMAYFDVAMVGNATFWKYARICFVEFILFFFGYLTGVNLK